MECPKCHKIVDDNVTICPHCRKVIALECPNCHSIGDSAVCEKCGYNILVKCAKCSKVNPIQNIKCSKCGFPLATSLAYQECESDDFAAITIKINSLHLIRKALKSRELYTKFLTRVKNLLASQLKGLDAKVVMYGDTYVINMNKELSFATSVNKAVRLALKIINSFVNLNSKMILQFETPLNISCLITRKSSENLLDLPFFDTNVKLLTIKKEEF